MYVLQQLLAGSAGSTPGRFPICLGNQEASELLLAFSNGQATSQSYPSLALIVVKEPAASPKREALLLCFRLMSPSAIRCTFETPF